jgi:transglutaminase-like putative cysteine protease
MEKFLRSTEVIDWKHPEVFRQAWDLADGLSDPVQVSRNCFEWVRDEIKHSMDFGLNPVTCKASEVLRVGSGFCFGKSHLLAALLRANGLPAGFCYQRLSRDDKGPPFCLHGLNAVFLPVFGWYRLDARGNRDGVNSQFTPPVEQLAFHLRFPGEMDLPEIWPDPLPVVIEALQQYATTDLLWKNLPDIELWKR